jgi:hypothetical protein
LSCNLLFEGKNNTVLGAGLLLCLVSEEYKNEDEVKKKRVRIRGKRKTRERAD